MSSNWDEEYVKLKGRLETQEDSTNKLITNSVVIKESLADSIKNSKQVFEAERAARLSTNGQIRMLTNVVGKLDRDIENIELTLNKNFDSLRSVTAHVHKLQNTYELDMRNILGKIEHMKESQTKLTTDMKILQTQGTAFAIFKENYERSFGEYQLSIHHKLCNLSSLMDKCERTCKDQMSFLLGEIADRIKKFELSCQEMYGEMKTYCQENFSLSDRQKESMEKNMMELIEWKFGVYDVKINEVRERCRCSEIAEKLVFLEKRLAEEELKNSAYEENISRLDHTIRGFEQQVVNATENVSRGFEDVTERVETLSADFDGKIEKIKMETTEKIENIKKALLRL